MSTSKEEWRERTIQSITPERRAAILDGHRHRLIICHDCDGELCSYCDYRGYVEVCEVCGVRMGSEGRKIRRALRAL